MKQVNTNLVNWAVVCVNEFARHRRLSPRDAFQYLQNFGGIEFIKEHYEAEHLLSWDDTVEDLGIVCRNNGGSL
ncbi:MAG: DUF3791 domain-containing protein [Oscillospiraceae bacterium]|nr:DUF3791 domain-containing protein [Oscillospiraceae bacterium]